MGIPKKFLIIGLLLTGGAVLLLFYFLKQPEKASNIQIKEASTLVHSEKRDVREDGEGLKQEAHADIKILPLDRKISSEIKEKWKNTVREHLEKVINEGNKGAEDFLISTAIGVGEDFRAQFKELSNSQQRELKFIAALGLANAKDGSEISELEWVLKNGSWKQRLLAAKALALNGDERGLPQVMEISGHQDWGVRIEAVRTLGYFNSGAGKDKLFSYLNSGDEHIRTSAAGALAMLGEEKGVNYLKSNLTHHDPAVQIYSAEILARIKNPAPVPLFVKEISSDDPFERIHGAVYLIVLGDERGVDIVRNALNNPDENTGRYALELLGENIRYLE